MGRAAEKAAPGFHSYLLPEKGKRISALSLAQRGCYSKRIIVLDFVSAQPHNNSF